MKTYAAFIRTNGVVKLYFAFVVNPCHTKSDNPVRLDHTLDYAGFFKLGVLVVNVAYRQEHLSYSLKIFFLSGVFYLKGIHDTIDIHI